MKQVLCAALLALWSAPVDAGSVASITPIPAEARRVSNPVVQPAAMPLSSMTALAVGEVANFTANDELKPVPNIEFRTLNNRPVRLEAFKGKVLVVNFWATWCAPCKRELPSLDRLQQQVGTDDLAVLAISIDRRGADKVGPYLDEVALPHLAVYLDQKNKLGRAFGASGYQPLTLWIGVAGKWVVLSGQRNGIATRVSPSCAMS